MRTLCFAYALLFGMVLAHGDENSDQNDAVAPLAPVLSMDTTNNTPTPLP